MLKSDYVYYDYDRNDEAYEGEMPVSSFRYNIGEFHVDDTTDKLYEELIEYSTSKHCEELGVNREAYDKCYSEFLSMGSSELSNSKVDELREQYLKDHPDFANVYNSIQAEEPAIDRYCDMFHDNMKDCNNMPTGVSSPIYYKSLEEWANTADRMGYSEYASVQFDGSPYKESYISSEEAHRYYNSKFETRALRDVLSRYAEDKCFEDNGINKDAYYKQLEEFEQLKADNLSIEDSKAAEEEYLKNNPEFAKAYDTMKEYQTAVDEYCDVYSHEMRTYNGEPNIHHSFDPNIESHWFDYLHNHPMDRIDGLNLAEVHWQTNGYGRPEPTYSETQISADRETENLRELLYDSITESMCNDYNINIDAYNRQLAEFESINNDYIYSSDAKEARDKYLEENPEFAAIYTDIEAVKTDADKYCDDFHEYMEQYDGMPKISHDYIDKLGGWYEQVENGDYVNGDTFAHVQDYDAVSTLVGNSQPGYYVDNDYEAHYTPEVNNVETESVGYIHKDFNGMPSDVREKLGFTTTVGATLAGAIAAANPSDVMDINATKQFESSMLGRVKDHFDKQMKEISDSGILRSNDDVSPIHKAIESVTPSNDPGIEF